MVIEKRQAEIFLICLSTLSNKEHPQLSCWCEKKVKFEEADVVLLLMSAFLLA
jgi:hypothetical protein